MPSYGDVDTGTTNLSPGGRNDTFSGYKAEKDPYAPEYVNSPYWEFKNGNWVNKASGKSHADNSGPGGSATPGYWLEGLFSGKRDLMGKDTPAEAARKRAEAEAAARAGQQDQITARMQAFIDELAGPVKGTPVYEGLMQAGLDAAQKHAGSAGLAGRSTLAGTQAASVAQQNVQPWLAARQGVRAQMLGQLSNRDVSLANIAQGQQQINQGMAESQYNATKNTMGTLGAIGGGILGGIYGGPGGATVGSQLGGAALGTIGGGQAPYTPSSYNPGSNWKPRGGGSGSGY